MGVIGATAPPPAVDLGRGAALWIWMRGRCFSRLRPVSAGVDVSASVSAAPDECGSASAAATGAAAPAAATSLLPASAFLPSSGRTAPVGLAPGRWRLFNRRLGRARLNRDGRPPAAAGDLAASTSDDSVVAAAWWSSTADAAGAGEVAAFGRDRERTANDGRGRPIDLTADVAVAPSASADSWWPEARSVDVAGATPTVPARWMAKRLRAASRKLYYFYYAHNQILLY